MADETELQRSMNALYLAVDSDIAKHHNELTMQVIRELKTEIEELKKSDFKLREFASKVIGDEGPDLDSYLDGHAETPSIKALKEELKTTKEHECQQEPDHEMVGLVREITDAHGASAVPFLDDAVQFLIDELEWLRFYKQQVWPCLGAGSGEILDSIREQYTRSGKVLPSSETD